MMDTPGKSTTTKPAGSPRMDPAQAFRATVGNGSAQAQEAFDKMSAATAEATNLMKEGYSTAVMGAQDYNNKVLEFFHTNTQAAVEFVQKLSTVKTPSEFFELSGSHSSRQLETLSEQTRELAALAQKVMLASAEPFKAGATRVFSDRP